jgi:hypothetical protein
VAGVGSSHTRRPRRRDGAGCAGVAGSIQAGRHPGGAGQAGGEYADRAASVRSDAFTGSPVGAGQQFPLTVAGLAVKTDPVYWDAEAADVVVADWSNVLSGVRQDIHFDFSNGAVITDGTGAIVNNMWQRDSTSVRHVGRAGRGGHAAEPVI